MDLMIIEKNLLFKQIISQMRKGNNNGQIVTLDSKKLNKVFTNTATPNSDRAIFDVSGIDSSLAPKIGFFVTGLWGGNTRCGAIFILTNRTWAANETGITILAKTSTIDSITIADKKITCVATGAVVSYAKLIII